MNKVVLITGASGDIGSAIATKFAKNNYDIVIHYNTNKEKANILAKSLKEKYNINTICIKANLENEQDIINMIKEIDNKFHRLDTLINNAGIAIDTILEQKTKEIWQKTLDINLIAPYLLSKYAKELMLKNNKGSIVNISSTNGIDSYYPFSIDYDSSKAGINILTKNLAVAFAPQIRVNAIAPGWVNTKMNKELDKEFIKKEKSKIALKRFAEPEEIAQIAYFLASEESSYINGSILVADGGRI